MFDTPPGVYTDITVGTEHACALTEDGEAVCWGVERGDVWDTPPGTYSFIEAEGNTTCAITDEGAVVCWATGGAPIGEGEPDPSRDSPPGRYKAISWGFFGCLRGEWASVCEGFTSGPPPERFDWGVHACALTEEGEAVCWGLLTDLWPEPPSGPFVTISGPEAFGALGGEWDLVCAVSEAGEAVCWGTWNREHRVDRWPAYDSQYVQVEVNRYATSCYLTADGWFSCQLGIPEDDVRYTAMSTEGYHQCAITDAGKAVCWTAASLWWDQKMMMMVPPDPGSERFTTISSGEAFGYRYGYDPAMAYACALTETGQAVCWKNVANKFERPDPDPNRYVAVSDSLNHTCALTEGGAVRCWGWNNHGQAKAPPGRYASISAGVSGSCALTEAREVVCWGASASLGFEPGSYKAVVATGYGLWAGACAVTESGTEVCRSRADDGHHVFEETESVREGSFSTIGGQGACGLMEGGALICWRGTGGGESQAVQLPGSYLAVSDGPGAPCGVTEAAEVVCWGHGVTGQWSPDLPDRPYLAVSAGDSHGCALTDAGEAHCWGEFTEPGSGPVDPPPGRYVAISASYSRTCAVTESGEVVCWGNTSYTRGQVPSK